MWKCVKPCEVSAYGSYISSQSRPADFASCMMVTRRLLKRGSNLTSSSSRSICCCPFSTIWRQGRIQVTGTQCCKSDQMQTLFCTMNVGDEVCGETDLFPDVVMTKKTSNLSFCQHTVRVWIPVVGKHVNAQSYQLRRVQSSVGEEKQREREGERALWFTKCIEIFNSAMIPSTFTNAWYRLWLSWTPVRREDLCDSAINKK